MPVRVFLFATFLLSIGAGSVYAQDASYEEPDSTDSVSSETSSIDGDPSTTSPPVEPDSANSVSSETSSIDGDLSTVDTPAEPSPFVEDHSFGSLFRFSIEPFFGFGFGHVFSAGGLGTINDMPATGELVGTYDAGITFPNFSIGFLAGYSLFSSLGFDLGLLYADRRIEYVDGTNYDEIQDDGSVIQKAANQIALNYLEVIPISITFHPFAVSLDAFDRGTQSVMNGLFIRTALSLGFYLGGHRSTNGQTADRFDCENRYITSESYDCGTDSEGIVTNRFDREDISTVHTQIQLALGWQIPVLPDFLLVASASYSLSLNSVVDKLALYYNKATAPVSDGGAAATGEPPASRNPDWLGLGEFSFSLGLRARFSFFSRIFSGDDPSI